MSRPAAARSAPHALSVRPRRPDDVPRLVEVLLAQQPLTRYPVRDPLPFPVERFLHADDARAAWVAEIGSRVVGHVCRVGPPTGSADAEAMNAVAARAHGCPVDRLGWVATLFVDPSVGGRGVGRALLGTAVDDVRASGLSPCLEVLPVHAAALSLYRSEGWREAGRLRPAWLEDALGDDGPDVQVLVLSPSRPG